MRSAAGQASLLESVQAEPMPCTPRTPLAAATHPSKADPRNADVLVGMRDGVSGRFSLAWRPCAKVSVLDAGFMGDGCCEEIGVAQGVLVFARVRNGAE